jgi:hypothetical protein
VIQYIELVHGDYKPTNITGGHHLDGNHAMLFCGNVLVESFELEKGMMFGIEQMGTTATSFIYGWTLR